MLVERLCRGVGLAYILLIRAPDMRYAGPPVCSLVACVCCLMQVVGRNGTISTNGSTVTTTKVCPTHHATPLAWTCMCPVMGCVPDAPGELLATEGCSI